MNILGIKCKKEECVKYLILFNWDLYMAMDNLISFKKGV
jgi:hypothetical protein